MNPNWKNAADYPPVKGTSLNDWAWEFLRRNQEFVVKYKAAEAAEAAERESNPAAYDDVAWSQTPSGKVLKEYGVKYPPFLEWVAEGIIDSPIFHTHPIHVHDCKVESAGAMFTNEDVGKHYKIILAQPDKAVLEFDLSQPLIPQLERAKQMLLAMQLMITGENKTAKAIVTLFPWYLRVLDAYLYRMHSAKICEVLSLEYPDAVSNDTLRNWKKTAELMRDGGYLDLVQKPTP